MALDISKLSEEDKQAIKNGGLPAAYEEMIAKLGGRNSMVGGSVAEKLEESARDIRAQLLIDDQGESVEQTNERRDEIVGELLGNNDEFGNAPTGLEALEAAAGRAGASDDAALQAFLDDIGGYSPLAASDYVGDIESEAALAEADPNSIAAQNRLLGKYGALMDPTVTAKERFLMEQSRVQEEMDRRAAMDAALRDLEFRGARSGGAEIAALTGAQQITSQNRMLQDLGTAAGAVDRSMSAMEGYGRTADSMRSNSFNEDFSRGSAADVIAQGNQKLTHDYNVFKDEFTAKERDADVGRKGSMFDARNMTTDRDYGRAGSLYNEKEDAAGLRLGVESEKEASDTDYLKLGLGKIESEKADEALEDDEDFI